MNDDFFQTKKSDFFQTDFFPGRTIPELLAPHFAHQPLQIQLKQQFVLDERNDSDWITVIYKSVYFAERAANKLKDIGLRTYYPKHRIVVTNVSKDEVRERMTAAYGRYLFIQLPEHPETLVNLQIDEQLLAGPFNQNGVESIISIDGEYSLTRNREIDRNRNFHEKQNKRNDPKVALRFRAGDLVLVTEGTLEGHYVVCLEDIKMSYKLKSKVEVQLGKNGARHYTKVGSLQAVTSRPSKAKRSVRFVAA